MRLFSRFRLGYGLALGAVLLATVLESFLPEQLIDSQPFIPYYLAFLTTIWLGGWRPALLATAVGGLLAVYFYCEPHNTLWMENLDDQAGLVMYAVICLTIVALVARLQRSRRGIQQRAEELADARAAAEAATRSKSAFLAAVSHELRTPMTSILGMSEVALEEEMPPPVRECLETVKTSADALLALLNDLLDFSRIEAGKVTLEMCYLQLRGVVQETLKILSVRAQEKGLALKSEVDPEVPDDLVGDPLRLRQVLTNLVGNAIKFTERGQVIVRVRVERQTPESSRLRFEVADTGIGISPEEQQRIFAPFTQADVSTTRRYGGTGLGLSITGDLVRLMGGRLEVESQPGRGSVFSFAIEFRHAAPSAAPCQEREHPHDGLPASARPLRILLAEDTLANQKLIVRILTKRGHRVEVAANGREAVELVSRQEFDLALMDVQMPVMDGLEATRAIRASNNGGRGHMPIIALTAHAMKTDQDRCLEAGMDAYLSKPLDSRELIRVVEELAGACRCDQ